MIPNSSKILPNTILDLIVSKLGINYVILDECLEISEWTGDFFSDLPLLFNDVLALSVFDVFPELQKFEAQIKLLLQNLTESITTEKIVRHLPDDSQLFFRLHVEKIPDEPQMLVICEEVTDEGELEESLRISYQEILMLHAKMDHTSARLSRLLERFMPAKVAKKIIHDEEVPFPGSNEVRECSILFTDMRNFTAFAEQVSPERTVTVLNRYFDVISASIEKYEGSIVQLIGDLLMATFNVPDDQPDHAKRACMAALEIRQNLSDMKNQASRDLPHLGFGIGIGTGLVTPSYIGSKNRFQFAAVGDVTNVSYHLCSKADANQIIIAQSTLISAREHSTLVQANSLGNFKLKRRVKDLKAYELISIT